MKVVLHKGKARPFFGRHPWVFAGAIARAAGTPEDGAEVELYTHDDVFIARGLWNSRSQIRVRLYSWQADRLLDEQLFRERIEAAIRFRETLDARPARRLIASEADGLSGLTVDQYGEYLVVQFTALGLWQRREAILDALEARLKPRGIYQRTEKDVGRLEGLEQEDQIARGQVPAEPIEITEAGVRFLCDLRVGQKTGFYLDQADNRQRVAGYARGRAVLDGFCYSGGFALHAARAGASRVVGIDGSDAAVVLARRNADLNRLSNVSFEKKDVFVALEERVSGSERFGLLVLDPPKFARSRQGVTEALKGYRRLLSLAVKLLEPDGILVFCCCSGRVPASALDETLAQVAENSGRDVQILERRGAAFDHPVSVSCPETEYLKCYICRVS